MANYNSTATVTLTVNGKQAQQVLKNLQQDAAQLERKISAASLAGDKVTMQRLQKELKSVNATMQKLQSQTATVEQVMSRLDRATPRELQKTLRTLQSQLNGIARGTAAWDAHTAKIRQVKAELAQVNAELAVTESWWDRFNNWLNECQTAILGLGAAVTGLVMAGKQAVSSFAEYDDTLVGVTKYTGMAKEEVIEMNEEFKKINTRSSIEDLNLLAQQAGRLGKQSREDVIGFVRAADQINVSLDDLGEDAVIKLSKLTQIFGDEKAFGTEQALLKVGSAINDLSQNCSASAPYLAEFSSRMGGVAAQAGLNIQQVLGYGAVLDTHNQKLEASATALSQVMVRIYREPAKYAKVAGLDVAAFTELVKTDMNTALMTMLEALNKAGGMDVLSPMFADMGENGSRAISALSTLAGSIDEVKRQQENATAAFDAGTSATEEYTRAKSSAKASMEMAQNRMHLLAIELGEKLYPLMRHIYSSSSVFLRLLSQGVDFVVKYKKEILVLTTAIAAYFVATKAAIIWQKTLTAVQIAGTAAAKALIAAKNLAAAP